MSSEVEEIFQIVSPGIDTNMNFREFVKMQEALFGTTIWVQNPGTARVGAKDPYLHQFGANSGGTSLPVSGAAPPSKMKKMKKK